MHSAKMPTADQINVEIFQGIAEAFRPNAVALFEEAFGSRFSVAIPNEANRWELLSASLNLGIAFAAVSDGRLIGLAGYKTEAGSFTDGMTFRALWKHLGAIRGTWAALILSFYERSINSGELLMDGIVVAESSRGPGIGSRLLNRLGQFAREGGYHSIRLEVIDTNPMARRMYERNGFVATRTELLRLFALVAWIRIIDNPGQNPERLNPGT